VSSRVRITEYLDVDVAREMWCCHVCGRDLIGARENYKRGYERDPKEIYPPIFQGNPQVTLTTADGYGVFVEFYCPGCGTMIENELLPPGYPPTHDIELDLEQLRARMNADAGEPELSVAGTAAQPIAR
jgi:acetophenone carboxylase